MIGRIDNTTPLTWLSAGAAAIVMPTASRESQANFATLARLIARQPDADARHRMFDQLSNMVLCNSGLSEGVAIFCDSVRDYHAPEPCTQTHTTKKKGE